MNRESTIIELKKIIDSLIKIVKSLQEENQQLKEIIKQKNNHISTLYSSIKEDAESNLRRR